VERIHQRFSRQGFMKTLGAEIESIEPGKVTLTVEFKIHFLKPAKTRRLVAVGQVIESGRTLTVC
jgi:acyl-coenzyme A thioesterase PaaI-like protein